MQFHQIITLNEDVKMSKLSSRQQEDYQPTGKAANQQNSRMHRWKFSAVGHDPTYLTFCVVDTSITVNVCTKIAVMEQQLKSFMLVVTTA